MDEYTVYHYIEFLMISLYLVFIFLSVQLCFIWIDVDKKELMSKISEDESLIKNSIIIVFFVGVFYIIHEFMEGTNRTYLIFELIELSGFISVLLFVYNWYLTLKTCSHRKKHASDILQDGCMSGTIKTGSSPAFWGLGRINSKLMYPLCIIGLILAFFVPVSTIYFTMIIVLLFVPPILALGSTLFGGFLMSKDLIHRQV